MSASLFFYDLETSGVSAKSARIMQFAGQRTTLDLEPIGEPISLYIKLSPDVLPDPEAILLTGITPQKTLIDGLTEQEFLSYFFDEIVQPGTTFLGFNSIRFDDEFMRYMLYRNFYDPYAWQWKNDCSRWDILDMVRMTRALRPEGIEWPFASDGRPTNRLEMLTAVNKLSHDNAHDAGSDVAATIAVTKLIADTQPDLYKYLFGLRSKKAVATVVESGKPFVYTSGNYSSDYLHTTVATLLAKKPKGDEALVYNLRVDPTPFLEMSAKELVAAWKYTRDPDAIRLPIKSIKYNRAPAVAPLGVINDAATEERLKIDWDEIEKNRLILESNKKAFATKMLELVAAMDAKRDQEQKTLFSDMNTVDEQLYSGFAGSGDANLMEQVHQSRDNLEDLIGKFSDDRFNALLPLYKARNYPNKLSSEERAAWEAHLTQKLMGGDTQSALYRYFQRLEELSQTKLPKAKQFLIEELQLYGQSLLP